MFLKRVRKFILGLILTLPMILHFAVSSAIVYGSPDTIDFVVDEGFILVGDRFTIEVRINASTVIGKVNLKIAYDNEKIAYATGPKCVTEEGDILTITDEGAGASNGEKVYILYFDAIASGEAYIKTAAPPEVYAASDGSEITVAVKTGKVRVHDNDVLSDDNSLKDLVIKDSSGKNVVLTPSFNPDINEYTAQVANDITKCLITADPGDPNAVIAVEGHTVLQVGEKNDIKITVTAEDGSRRIYTIHVDRKPARDPLPEPTVQLLSPTPQIVEKEPDKGIKAEFKGYGTFLTEYHTYVVATSVKDLKIPEDYEETSVFIGEDTIKVYAKKGTDPMHVLIALSDEQGNVDWYRYDRKEESLQKLWDEDITYKEVSLNYDAEVLLALKNAENKTIILAVAASLAGALALVFFIMNLVKKSRINALEDELSKSYKKPKSKTTSRKK